jgi:hypothetical protein
MLAILHFVQDDKITSFARGYWGKRYNSISQSIGDTGVSPVQAQAKACGYLRYHGLQQGASYAGL